MSVTGPVNYYIETPAGTLDEQHRHVNEGIVEVLNSLRTNHYIDTAAGSNTQPTPTANLYSFSLVVTGANVFEIHKSATAAYYAANEAGYNVAPAANHYTQFE